MKKWSIVTIFVVVLLAMIASPLAALAQTGDSGETSGRQPLRDGLAIVAPLATPVNTEISITVFQCSDQEPVEGAGVWLITRERAEDLRQEMAVMKRSANPDTSAAEFENLLKIHGTLIDRTNSEGKVWYSFESSGRYVLVAVFGGYMPDSRPISVGMLPRALAIDAPRKAEVDENVTITVFQRGTEDPVKDAGVWALTREDAESLKERLTSIRESGDNTTIDAAIQGILDVHGIFLGATNGAGKVKYAFEETGGHLLIARKNGYFPGWRPIAIGMLPKALAIDAPRKAKVEENVTITVLQRGTEDPVKDAGVWAFTREYAASLKDQIASIRESSGNSEIDAAIEEACNTYGIFLGTTNGAGKIKHAFEEAGGYLLVAWKQGFFPGWKPIVILPELELQSQARPEISGQRPAIKLGLSENIN